MTIVDDETTIDTLTPPATIDKTELWRFEELVRAGFPFDLAEAIAARNDIDLHQALELVASGCQPALAAGILL